MKVRGSKAALALISTYKPRIAEELRALQHVLEDFGGALESELLHAVVFEPIGADEDNGVRPVGYRELGFAASVEAAVTAYRTIDYGMSDRVNRSIKCYGAVGVLRRIMNMAVRVNREKSKFKATFREIANKRVRIAGRDSNNRPITELKALSTVILRQLQSSSVNRLAAYREVQLFDATPLSIAFTESHNRSVPTKSAAELIAELALRIDATVPDSIAADDIARLKALTDRNERLIDRKSLYPRMRANVKLREIDPKTDKQKTQMIVAEVPILYPITARMAPPDIHPPKVTAAPRQRALLSEPEPYIQTWPYYRLTPKGLARREKVAQSTQRK
ncbi:MAG: hypothetical protein ACR2P1_04080 [Pseudomonadales bacterium]